MKKDFWEMDSNFTEEDLDRAISKFDSEDPRVRCEDGYSTIQYSSRDGFWNPAENKYV